MATYFGAGTYLNYQASISTRVDNFILLACFLRGSGCDDAVSQRYGTGLTRSIIYKYGLITQS